ncbi:unnamed protein product, partial [Lampetra planeri]
GPGGLLAPFSLSLAQGQQQLHRINPHAAPSHENLLSVFHTDSYSVLVSSHATYFVRKPSTSSTSSPSRGRVDNDDGGVEVRVPSDALALRIAEAVNYGRTLHHEHRLTLPASLDPLEP